MIKPASICPYGISGDLYQGMWEIYMWGIYIIYIIYIYILYILYILYIIYMCVIYNMSRSKHELDSRIGGCFSID